MLKNLTLFTGEEKYLLHKEITRWKESFAEKFGKDAIFSFNSENFDIEHIKQAIFAGGLFVEKKLVLIYGLPTDGDKSNKLSAEITESLTNEIINKEGVIPEDTFLGFISYKPDKRGRMYKFLNKNVSVKEFKKLSQIELQNFAKKQLEGVNIDMETIKYFLEKVGDDMYHIINECQKLQILYKQNHTEITNDIINNINVGRTDTNVFDFFENFFGDQKKNISFLQKIEEEGTNRNQFLGTLCRGVKVYLYILDMDRQGIKDNKTVRERTKQSPYTINKNMKHIGKIREKETQIKKFYEGLMILDNNIKTGKAPESYFRLGIKKLTTNI